ncbi:hypothetical protein HZH68_003403 [Vespula germanica]|uniref:Uncharacterized protein n=1 Tax=Vespula germanica TaxID=30212 RepID=A0A834U358_VESGE|nr:hypothetical protein HZH68_003403 [Vespula germanica]
MSSDRAILEPRTKARASQTELYNVTGSRGSTLVPNRLLLKKCFSGDGRKTTASSPEVGDKEYLLRKGKERTARGEDANDTWLYFWFERPRQAFKELLEIFMRLTSARYVSVPS